MVFRGVESIYERESSVDPMEGVQVSHAKGRRVEAAKTGFLKDGTFK